MFHVLSWLDDGLVNVVVYLNGILNNFFWCHLIRMTFGYFMGKINRRQPLLWESEPILPRLALIQQEAQQVARVLYVHLVGF